ncbi:hypothetical protein IFM58399_10050 [Aspergillus lentulus]|uniref:Uncharacterized protein n=1 Tax=Aspergillus lentulus TaxID=293939 RepID=A0ABQ1B655_ASPLE|nr:uncharacterized protein IFM58399_10050 [Aspergillus lentulus]GFF55350.1 hypothetical protein IFM58399_10050 [Aspergillus lentulus]GFF75679.1 hypothetical protein IFM62136_09130 [Aspergillus lentulus]GFF94498.1 hypothetical protein IFM60648_10426 [Aspergillus lentulus]GFF97406.1 hypothetical protein IFM47457_11377 [Aspergillus lentulus]GFG03859.1 hypothetical protein IFM61392_03024 [Aspergillus lentulus]
MGSPAQLRAKMTASPELIIDIRGDHANLISINRFLPSPAAATAASVEALKVNYSYDGSCNYRLSDRLNYQQMEAFLH